MPCAQTGALGSGHLVAEIWSGVHEFVSCNVAPPTHISARRAHSLAVTLVRRGASVQHDPNVRAPGPTQLRCGATHCMHKVCPALRVPPRMFACVRARSSLCSAAVCDR